MSTYQNVKNSRQRLKARLVYIMGEKCCICGYNKCITALEFHHINPQEKEFTLSTNANIGFEKAKEEIKKCVLVCANCHREIHDGIIDCPKTSTYNEERGQEISQQILDLKTHKDTYCKKCGKVISNGSQYCSNCYFESQRIVERPSRQELKDLIRKETFVAIASKYQVSDNAIRKWCDAYSLPRKKTEIQKIPDSVWENI